MNSKSGLTHNFYRSDMVKILFLSSVHDVSCEAIIKHDGNIFNVTTGKPIDWKSESHNGKDFDDFCEFYTKCFFAGFVVFMDFAKVNTRLKNEGIKACELLDMMTRFLSSSRGIYA